MRLPRGDMRLSGRGRGANILTDVAPCGRLSHERQYKADEHRGWPDIFVRGAPLSEPTFRPEPAVLVGIDWATSMHVVCALDRDGRHRRRLEVPHSAEGFARLVSWVGGLSPDAKEVGVAIEDPHHPLVDWLLDKGMQVYALNPKQLDRFRDRHSVSGAKDDARDAYVLADALRTDLPKFSALALPDATEVAIRHASRRYDTLQKELNRHSNRLYELLLRTAPGLLSLCGAADEPFFWEILSLAPTTRDAAALRPARVRRVIQEHRKRKFSAEGVLTVLRAPRLPLVPGVAEAINEDIEVLLPILKTLHQQLCVTRKRLAELLGQAGRRAEILRSFRGIDIVLAATFLAEASQPLAERNLEQLRALCGTAPVTRRSGNSMVVTMRRACSRQLRDACFAWARTAITWDPVAAEHYRRLRAAGHRYTRALRGVADRLLSRLIAALKTDSLYRPHSPTDRKVAAVA